MKKTIKNWMARCSGKWDSIRFIRLLTGGGLALAGLFYGELLLTILGAWLLVMAVLNLSCCASGGCGVPDRGKGGFTRDIERYDPKQNRQ